MNNNIDDFIDAYNEVTTAINGYDTSSILELGKKAIKKRQEIKPKHISIADLAAVAPFIANTIAEASPRTPSFMKHSVIRETVDKPKFEITKLISPKEVWYE